jgi:hypothetical protein
VSSKRIFKCPIQILVHMSSMQFIIIIIIIKYNFFENTCQFGKIKLSFQLYQPVPSSVTIYDSRDIYCLTNINRQIYGKQFFFCSTLSEFENFLLCERTKKTYSTRSCVNWALFGTRGALKRSFHSRFKLIPKKPNLHTNSLNKLCTIKNGYFFYQCLKME